MDANKKLSFQALLAVLVLSGIVLAACDYPAITATSAKKVNPSPSKTSSPTPFPVATKPKPQPAGTIQPTQPLQVMFLEEDCAAEGLTVKDANYGPGALRCMYDNHLEIEIFQYTDPAKYQQVLNSSLSIRQTAIPKLKEINTAKKNYNQDIIQDDGTGMIYMETYDDNPSVGETEVSLCGNGQGSLGVEGKFVATLQINEACGLASTAGDYSRVMTTLRETALKAIARALAASGL